MSVMPLVMVFVTPLMILLALVHRTQWQTTNAKSTAGSRISIACVSVCLCTFTLWGVLAAVPEDVDLVDGAVRLKQFLQLLL